MSFGGECLLGRCVIRIRDTGFQAYSLNSLYKRTVLSHPFRHELNTTNPCERQGRSTKRCASRRRLAPRFLQAFPMMLPKIHRSCLTPTVVHAAKIGGYTLETTTGCVERKRMLFLHLVIVGQAPPSSPPSAPSTAWHLADCDSGSEITTAADCQVHYPPWRRGFRRPVPSGHHF